MVNIMKATNEPAATIVNTYPTGGWNKSVTEIIKTAPVNSIPEIESAKFFI